MLQSPTLVEPRGRGRMTKCRRCQRTLSNSVSVDTEHGPDCLAKMLKAAPPGTKQFQIDKAMELINTDGIFWVSRLECYLAVSSSGRDSYLTNRMGCSCPATGLCYHRVAVHLLSA